MNTKDKITVQWETIGPNEAVRILQNIHPRQKGRDSEYIYRSYADQMTNGRWDESVASPICIDEHGRLSNGYHRMRAVALSGMTIRFLVVRGEPETAFENHDNLYSRSLGFRLGIDKDTISVLTTIIHIVRYGSLKTKVVNDEVCQVRDFMSPIIERFGLVAGTTRKARISSASIRSAVMLSAMRYPSFEDQIFIAYKNLVAVNLTYAPRSMSALYRRLTETNNPPMNQVALAWKAFSPSRFGDVKIQINDLSQTIHDIRRTVLRDLIISMNGEVK